MTEQEMVYLYRSERHPMVRDMIYEKNHNMLKALTHNLVKSLSRNVTIDNDDYISNTYVSFMKCLKEYDLHQIKYTFAQALAMINHGMLIRQGRKMISLHNRAITYSTCNRNVYEWAVNASENTELERIERQIDQELMLEKINKFLNNFSEKTRKLIQMKSQGCGNKEISRQIGISVRGVNARFNLVRRAFLIRYGRNCHI